MEIQVIKIDRTKFYMENIFMRNKKKKNGKVFFKFNQIFCMWILNLR